MCRVYLIVKMVVLFLFDSRSSTLAQRFSWLSTENHYENLEDIITNLCQVNSDNCKEVA